MKVPRTATVSEYTGRDENGMSEPRPDNASVRPGCGTDQAATGSRAVDLEVKREVLESLRIDRHASARERADRSARGWMVLSFVLVGALVLLMWWRWPLAESNQVPASATSPAASSFSEPTAAADAQLTEAALSSASTPASSGVLDVPGYITATRIATVSAKTIGLITEVLVEEGMAVERGQVLATLDASLAELDLSLTRARLDRLLSDIERVELELAEAQRVYDRQLRLVDENFTSEAELTRTRNALETLAVSRKSLQLDARIAELQVARQRRALEDFTIVAPFSGIVLAKNAQREKSSRPARREVVTPERGSAPLSTCNR